MTIRILSFALFLAMLGCSENFQTESFLAVSTDLCDTSVGRSLVGITAAKMGSTRIYQVNPSVCNTPKRGLYLADEDLDPVIILYTPDKTNLTSKQNQQFGPNGLETQTPEYSGTIERNGQRSQIDSAATFPQGRMPYTPPGGTEELAFPTSAIFDRQAVEMSRKLAASGRPTLLVNAHDSNASITKQSQNFLDQHPGKTTVLDIGHGWQQENGKLGTGSVDETFKEATDPYGKPVVTTEKKGVSYDAVDKINAVFAGSDRPGQCITTRCFGGSLADDGLDPKVRQLMTFTDDKTVSYPKNNIDLLGDYLVDQKDTNGDGTSDLRDIRQDLVNNRDQLDIPLNKFEVRPAAWPGEANNKPFVAIENQNPRGTVTGPSQTYPGEAVYVNGQPAYADLRVTPETINTADQTRVFDRNASGDGFTQVEGPSPVQNKPVLERAPPPSTPGPNSGY